MTLTPLTPPLTSQPGPAAGASAAGANGADGADGGFGSLLSLLMPGLGCGAPGVAGDAADPGAQPDPAGGVEGDATEAAPVPAPTADAVSTTASTADGSAEDASDDPTDDPTGDLLSAPTAALPVAVAIPVPVPLAIPLGLPIIPVMNSAPRSDEVALPAAPAAATPVAPADPAAADAAGGGAGGGAGVPAPAPSRDDAPAQPTGTGGTDRTNQAGPALAQAAAGRGAAVDAGPGQHTGERDRPRDRRSTDAAGASPAGATAAPATGSPASSAPATATAAPTAPAAPTSSTLTSAQATAVTRQVMDRVTRLVSEHTDATGQLTSAGRSGPRSLVVRLDPGTLGEVRLEVHLRGGGLQVSLQASDSGVQRALQRDLGSLRDALGHGREHLQLLVGDVRAAAGVGAPAASHHGDAQTQQQTQQQTVQHGQQQGQQDTWTQGSTTFSEGRQPGQQARPDHSDPGRSAGTPTVTTAMDGSSTPTSPRAGGTASTDPLTTGRRLDVSA